MVSNVMGADVGDVLGTAFTDADETLLVVDPSAETIVSLVEAGVERDGLPAMSMLADEDVLKAVMGDFLIASKAANLVDADALSIRLLPSEADNTLFVSKSRVLAPVTSGERVTALSSDDEEFVSAAFETYRSTFDGAEEYHLRTPPISRVRETMAAEIGEEAREDFDRVLSSMESVRGNGEGLDEVTVSLLVAAKNEVLLYDISKWGEDVGIASKATFSRTKTRLEDQGLIDTEKVPIDVGRPRLRLKIGDDRLADVDADELADAVRDAVN